MSNLKTCANCKEPHGLKVDICWKCGGMAFLLEAPEQAIVPSIEPMKSEVVETEVSEPVEEPVAQDTADSAEPEDDNIVRDVPAES